MQHAHRMPLVYRRMFVTSICSKYRGKSDNAPKSSFAERFGSPTQSQAQDSQTSFPTWPGLQSAQASPNINSSLGLKLPPPNLITPERETADDSKQTISTSTTRRYRRSSQLGQKPKELFSDRIGNASSFVNTSSFEAKVAMEPAAHTLNRWMVAAKNNIDRFKSIPEPVVHTFEPSIPPTHSEEPADSETTVPPTFVEIVRHLDVGSSLRNPSASPAGHEWVYAATLCNSVSLVTLELFFIFLPAGLPSFLAYVRPGVRD
ncbi:unnamed protein product [Rhizoctonia solani]|uniref:Uncharacterized protein n=1 Tax=Rhizoctonia solani TaxID=456999 RepID=A0A8H3DFJ8_9AGAM|nr:unnamed protein product [Rhizoctonia solani]